MGGMARPAGARLPLTPRSPRRSGSTGIQEAYPDRPLNARLQWLADAHVHTGLDAAIVAEYG